MITIISRKEKTKGKKMDEINEKGPAVSSDATYMVLGFVSVVSFFISLPFRERQTPMWVQLFSSFLYSFYFILFYFLSKGLVPLLFVTNI